MSWPQQLAIGLLLLTSRGSYEDRPIPTQSSQLALGGQTYQIPIGTVGIGSVRAETPANYRLKLIFPSLKATQSTSQERAEIRLGANDRVQLHYSIQLFNADGAIVEIAKSLPVRIDRWCHNDGGIQYRSTVDLIVSKNELRAAIPKLDRVEKLTLFVVVGKIRDLKPVTTSIANTGTGRNQITRTLIVEGRQQANRLVARVFEEGNPRWNSCGDSDDRPALILETASAKSNLRCCGP